MTDSDDTERQGSDKTSDITVLEDLPTAATFTFNEEYSQGIKWNNDPPHLDIEEGDELVRRSDAEEAIQKVLDRQRQQILDRVCEAIAQEKTESLDARQEAGIKKAISAVKGLDERDGDKTEDGKRCRNCKGHFEIPEDDYGNSYGLTPNKSKSHLPDDVKQHYYCPECINILFESLCSQASSGLYKLFTPETQSEELREEVKNQQ